MQHLCVSAVGEHGEQDEEHVCRGHDTQTVWGQNAGEPLYSSGTVTYRVITH